MNLLSSEKSDTRRSFPFFFPHAGSLAKKAGLIRISHTHVRRILKHSQQARKNYKGDRLQWAQKNLGIIPRQLIPASAYTTIVLDDESCFVLGNDRCLGNDTYFKLKNMSPPLCSE